ncbi:MULTISPECIES: helix-turn-helix domain-containing protein [unclassified Nocardiopsis]|uniref:helix-turn-helix domain-containing protein n=1 Tax=Nocardiopsis TaxID=2013 RepID=UPI00387B760B
MHSPTARRRTLSAELAKLRREHRQPDGTPTTAAHVASTLGWQQSKLSRIETNQWKRPSPRDVQDLLDYYGAEDESYRSYILKLVTEGRSKAWWTEIEDLYASTNYIGLESAATRVRTWSPMLVPGLFQTRDYAAALFAGADIRNPEEVERRIDARMHRQQLLAHTDPPRVWAVIDESALRKAVGGRDVQAGQVRHLLTITEQENLTLQVMRDAAGAHAGMAGAFTLLDFEAGDQPVVHLENFSESLLLEAPEKTDRYDWLFHHVSAAASSPADTTVYLHELLTELEAP